MPTTTEGIGRALHGVETLGGQRSAQVVVCDSVGAIAAVREAFDAPAVTWAGRRGHWHTADWAPLAGRRVLCLAASSEASRARMRDIAKMLAGARCQVRIALPEGVDGTDVASWVEAEGPEGARRYVASIVEDFTPPPPPKAAPSAPRPDTSRDWLWRNEHFEVMGHEAGQCFVRWGGEIVSMPMERLASPAKLKTLAPPAWWSMRTGEEKITGEVAGQLGWALAASARERGTMADYDRDGSIVGLPGDRVLELETGHARDRERQDRVLRSLAVEPAEGSPSLWLDSLGEILAHLPDTADVIEYLRRWLGVSLTTDCSNESMLLCIGKPGCGKSTILDTWQVIAGSYCTSLPGAYVAGQQQSSVRHLVADLRGARVVRVGELPDRGRWNATEDINALVSGEVVKADKKYANAMEFQSVAHLMISGNTHPRADANSGLFRRMRLINLRVLERQDDGLKARMRAPDEMGRILSWALSGLRDGGLRGHPVPVSMRAAATGYRDGEDVIGRFIGDRCVRDDNAMTSFGDLFEAFEKWAEDEKMKPWPRAGFGRALNDFGEFPEYRGAGGARLRIGVRVAGAQQSLPEYDIDE